MVYTAFGKTILNALLFVGTTEDSGSQAGSYLCKLSLPRAWTIKTNRGRRVVHISCYNGKLALHGDELLSSASMVWVMTGNSDSYIRSVPDKRL